MKTFVDKAGRPLLPGDFIVYGHALGRCAGLRYGKVLEIVEKESPYCKEITTKVRVIGANDDWCHTPAQLLSHPSMLLYSERVLRISEEQIPDKVLKLLKGFSLKEKEK